MISDTVTTAYGITRTVAAGYDETIARVRELLREEGFGVLTEIDVKHTLKEKIGKDIDPYVILGACNPKFAAQSLQIEPDIGLLLPCNIIVAQRTNGTRVGVVNPQSLVQITSNPVLTEIANDVDARLRRVIERL